MAGNILGCHKWRGSTHIRNISKHPTMHGADPLTNNYLDQNFNNTVIEELWPDKNHHFPQVFEITFEMFSRGHVETARG